ncbi:MAG: ABC transporter substrate-binding protein, partial [Actinomycetota bacterium]
MGRTSALVVCLAVVVAACGGTSASPTSSPNKAKDDVFPVTIPAANGEVAVASRPRSIVSLSPTATEMLFAIGA